MKKNLLITIILLISCSQNNFKPFDLFDLKEKEIVIKNKIKEIREIEIAIDTAGVSLWKRVTNIKHYNKDGNLTLSLTPNYLRKPLPDFGTSGIKLNEIEHYLKMSQTNIPNGEIDTTFFNYDKNQNLIEIKSDLTTTFKYDDFHNEIEKCIFSDMSETICVFSKYKYDNNGRIIYRIDSSGIMSNSIGKNNKPSSKNLYNYDNEGRIVSNGIFVRQFNKKGQLIEVKDISRNDRYLYDYDNEGKRISETLIKAVSSFFDTKKNINIVTSTETFKTFFYYNEKGLLREEKKLDKNNKLISLTNYEYVFY